MMVDLPEPRGPVMAKLESVPDLICSRKDFNK